MIHKLHLRYYKHFSIVFQTVRYELSIPFILTLPLQQPQKSPFQSPLLSYSSLYWPGQSCYQRDYCYCLLLSYVESHVLGCMLFFFLFIWKEIDLEEKILPSWERMYGRWIWVLTKLALETFSDATTFLACPFIFKSEVLKKCLGRSVCWWSRSAQELPCWMTRWLFRWRYPPRQHIGIRKGILPSLACLSRAPEGILWYSEADLERRESIWEFYSIFLCSNPRPSPAFSLIISFKERTSGVPTFGWWGQRVGGNGTGIWLLGVGEQIPLPTSLSSGSEPFGGCGKTVSSLKYPLCRANLWSGSFSFALLN